MAKYVLSALSALVCVQSVISISDGDVQCEKPPEFERSRPCKQYEEFPVGTNVKYCCDHGFRFSGGVRSATCEFDNSKGVAEWKVPAHSCQVVTCPKPENIEKGKVTYLSTEYASTVKYECETGYRVEGKSERRCTHEGVWDGDEPTCVEVVCPQPKDPVFGKVIVHGGTRKDSLISFTCDKDTQLIGESFAKCMEDGTWSADPPLCAKPCVVPVLGRGQMGIKERTWDRRSRQWIFTRVYPGTEFKHGDKLLLKCDKEFELPIEDLEPGEVEVICNSGTFNPSPACHPAWCRGPLPNNGRGTPPSPPYNKENGSLVIYEDPCRGIGELRRRKTALCYRGRWIVTDEICHDPRCKGEELEKFYVKAINGSEFYDDGEEVEVQCKNGYEKVSERGILCSNGEWQVTQHPCKPASCNYPPPEIDNGKAQISSHSHGVNVRYTCNPPYRLVPRGTIVCSNGQWIGKLPKCEIEPCTVPMLHRGKMGIKEHRGAREKFTQIHHDTKVQSGDKLLLRCNEEFELPVEDLPPGDIEVICDGGVLKPKPACHPAWCRGPLPDNGRGVPTPPPYNKENGSVVVYTDSCLNIGRTIQEKKALCVRGRWKIMDEECEDMRCNARDLENYYVDTSGQEYFGNRKVIEVQCKIGYEKTIDDISCIDGHWQITSAPCKPAFCRDPPPNIEHGKAAVSSGEHGTNVDYTCFPPYELVSRGSVACSHGQWTGALPMCKDTRCNTYSLSVYDGVKAENKTIKSSELYTPSCRDGYDSLEVELRCYKGNWANSQRNPRFCKPGDCAVPYVVYGDFYTLKITNHWWRGEERKFEEVLPHSIATHNTVMYFRCRGGRKFQGITETDGDGVQVICKLKQWTPKPECWFSFCRDPPPNIEHGKAAVSSGEHGTNVDYTCFPPYELVSRGSVACSHGQWTGALPMCKDTRCNTYSLSVYDGVKAENKTIKSRELYTPSCHDGYDSLEVELRCYKGNWAIGQRNPRFCKPGDCAVPNVVYGDFYTLKITNHWWRGEERKFEEVLPHSIATHNTVMYFRCRGGRKFQGRTETDGDGVQVICKLKQWTPKPECWFFPQTTTAAPTTIEQTTELQLDDGKAKVALENNTLGIGATENGTNEDEAEALHNLTLQEKNCKYENNDKHLLMFFEDQVISNGTLPEGSIMKFGCQPIGFVRLHGGDSALCTNGEWKMSAYPKCLMPLNKEDVTILFYTDKTYETRPGDVALVWKDSMVGINCYNILQESRPPQLYHRDLNKHIYGTEESSPDGFRYAAIRIESMEEEYVGTYECSYGADSHRITLTLADTEGKTFCPSLNATDRLRINYDPDENQIVPGTRAIFSCKDVMSELLGEKEIVCLKSGAWASSPPICVRKCWPTPEIENGYKEGDSFTVGSEVTYRCDRGYKLIGSSKLRCEENSLWSHNLPRCAGTHANVKHFSQGTPPAKPTDHEIRCPKPVDVANAVVHFTSLRFNAKVEYRCNKGYKLVGNSTSHCNENGKWTNRPPFCEEKPIQCNSNDLLDKLPEGVFGENITGEFMPSGSVIRLVCGHPSQIIIGDKYGNCTSAGYWRVGNTKCVIGCKAVEKPDDSSLIIGGLKDIYRFGDSVTFSCPAGEQLSLDLEVIFCLSTGWSDDRVPECLSPKQ